VSLYLGFRRKWIVPVIFIDVMKPIAMPPLGGMAVSVITMFIVPCLFSAVEEWKWKRKQRLASNAATA